MILVMLAIAFQAQSALAKEVVATVDDNEITEAQVMKIASTRMMKALSQIYDIKRGAVEQIIDDLLLEREAKKKGKTAKALKKEISDSAGKATESEAKVIYEMNKKRYKGKTFEELKSRLIGQLNKQKKQMKLYEYIKNLRAKAKIKINLERPRAKVSIDDDPGQGNKKAPIVLIEFSDFQCPFCKRVRPSIARLMKDYKGKIYYVFRDYPLSFHGLAKDGANAANCANEQGKYWEYNAKLWDDQQTIFSKKLSKEEFYGKLKQIAKDLSLKTSKFNSCLESKKYFKEIEKDLQDGMAAGVTGTPAYFINGLFLSGAQPYEAFKTIVDEELAK